MRRCLARALRGAPLPHRDDERNDGRRSRRWTRRWMLRLDERFFRLETERTQGLPPEERRERIARVRGYLRGRMAPRFAGGAEADVEVQVLRIGDARLAALPLEATVDVGRDWKARVAAPAALLSIANGWLRYLPHESNFREPGAHRHYEVLMSTFEADAASRLLEQAERLERGLAAELGA
jgi:hypothetical protein